MIARGLIFIIFLFLSAFAKGEEIGIGGVLGAPTGVSAHKRLSQDNNLVGALSYNTSRYRGFQIHADYLWDNKFSIDIGKTPWGVYYGAGGRAIFISSGDDKDKLNLGIRGPVGIFYYLDDPKIVLFGELAPVLNVMPSSEISFDMGIGVRVIL